MTVRPYCYFEMLPNEILLMIFQYLSIYHLHRAFARLNQRLNGVLHSVQHLALTSLFADDEELRSIVKKDFSHLKRIALGFSAISDRTLAANICQRLFTATFPHLTYCSLWPPMLSEGHSTAQNFALKFVHLREGNFRDLNVVLQACPNLFHLNVNGIHRSDVRQHCPFRSSFHATPSQRSDRFVTWPYDSSTFRLHETIRTG
jgi:hypothetical protein